MWNDRYTPAGMSLWGRANFDPGTMLMAASMGATAAGGALSASSTLAGGNAAAAAGAATQEAMTAEGASAFASAQRQSLDTAQRARLAISSATARAAASGVDAGSGSAVENIGQIAQRGSYQALMDLYNGQSKQQALEYEGEEASWEGQQQQSSSQLAAMGTLAGTAGSMMQTYGMVRFPQLFGRGAPPPSSGL